MSQQLIPIDSGRLARALSGFMSPDAFLAHWMVALAPYRNYDKVADVIMECAALQLLPSLNQVVLVPRKDRDTGRPYLTAMLTWRGMLALIYRSGLVQDVRVELVHKNDEFCYANGEVVHRYDPFDEKRIINSPEDIRGGYIVVTYKDGRDKRYHFVPVALIEKARRCARSDEVWSRWYAEQAYKTVIRNAFARQVIPVDPAVQMQMTRVFENEDELLGNDPSRVEPTAAPAIAAEPAEHDTSRMDYYADRIVSAVEVDEVTAIMAEARADKNLTIEERNKILTACIKHKRVLRNGDDKPQDSDE